jgi:RNA polymerase sigma-70 factor (ECF subfamily)
VPEPKPFKPPPSAHAAAAWTEELDAAYRTHAGWLVAFLARRFGRQIAEDLAQETFLRLARAPIDWRTPKSVLARAALNVAQDHLRREGAQRRPRLVSDGGVAEAVTLPDQDESALHREVVAKLPRNLRDVYCLSRFGGMTYDEIAAHTGLSVKAVEKRMTKALKLCVAWFRA